MKKTRVVAIMVLAMVLVLAGSSLMLSCAKPAPPAGPATPAQSPAPKPAAAPAPKADWPRAISIGTAGVGGGYYALGVGMAPIIKKYAGIDTTAEATGGAAANINLMRSKTIEFAFVNIVDLSYAWLGTPTGLWPQDPQRFIRIVHTGHNSGGTWVATEASGVKSIKDLKGKRVITWTTSASVMQWHTGSLQAYGLSRQDVKEIPFISYGEAITALVEGRADAFPFPGLVPTASVIEITSRTSSNILGLEPDKIEWALKNYPALTTMTIPPGTYKGQNEQKVVLACTAPLIVHKDMPDSLVYEVSKALMDHPDETGKIVAVEAKEYVPELFFRRPMAAYHPGAIKYYKEKGLWKAEHDQFQEAILKKLG